MAIIYIGPLSKADIGYRSFSLVELLYETQYQPLTLEWLITVHEAFSTGNFKKCTKMPQNKKNSKSACKLIWARVGAMFSAKCELCCAVLVTFIRREFGNFGGPKPQTM